MHDMRSVLACTKKGSCLAFYFGREGVKVAKYEAAEVIKVQKKEGPHGLGFQDSDGDMIFRPRRAPVCFDLLRPCLLSIS